MKRHPAKRITAVFLAVALLLPSAFAVSAAALQHLDFSESNMLTNTSSQEADCFARQPDDGGNEWLAAAYLASWDGPVLEADDPFPASGEPEDLEYRELDAAYHVQEVLTLPCRTDSLDNSLIKEAVMRYGAVGASFYSDMRYYNDDLSTYYMPKTFLAAGAHAVLIVGWDDNFSRNNFKKTPPGDGAFLCRNSWGTEAGDEGYFYISYYDSYFGTYNSISSFCNLESTDNFDRIYQYDPPGVNATLQEGMLFQANAFPEKGKVLSQDETLRAVSFYTYDCDTTYNIYLVTDYETASSFSKRVLVESGTIAYSGYHTVRLSEEVTLEAGTRFAVAVELAVDGEPAIPYVETPISSSVYGTSRANSGESFYSEDGDSWFDLTNDIENCNFCIKAFTDTVDPAEGSVSARRPLGVKALNAIDNTSRRYESEKTYTVAEAVNAGLKFSDSFMDYIKSHPEEGSDLSATSVPAMTPLGSAQPASVGSAEDFPAEYDLRDYSRVSSVKDQLNINGCWAFSAYGSLESYLLAPDGSTPTMNIRLDKTFERLLIGDTLSLSATDAYLSEIPEEITWVSSDPSVAAVSDGVVTAVGSGTAVISAQVDGAVSCETCTVVCSPLIPVTGIESEYSDSGMKLLIGKKYTSFYAFVPENATNGEISVESSDPLVVDYDAENDCLVAKGLGSAGITVKTPDGAHSVTIPVTVYALMFEEQGAAVHYKDTVEPELILGRGVEISTWKSSDTSVAAVDNNGKITAVGTGTATITAVDTNGNTAEFEISVSYTFWQIIIIYLLFGWLWY